MNIFIKRKLNNYKNKFKKKKFWTYFQLDLMVIKQINNLFRNIKKLINIQKNLKKKKLILLKKKDEMNGII